MRTLRLVLSRFRLLCSYKPMNYGSTNGSGKLTVKSHNDIDLGKAYSKAYFPVSAR